MVESDIDWRESECTVGCEGGVPWSETLGSLSRDGMT